MNSMEASPVNVSQAIKKAVVCTGGSQNELCQAEYLQG